MNYSYPYYGYMWVRKYTPKQRVLSVQTYRFIKRLFDFAVVFLTFPLWLPLIGMVALLIRITSPGAPVIFSQARTGKGGRRFQMFKFRTMVPNADALKEKYAHLNELQPPDFKITNDPRVTKVGRYLRKTSLDELPQLFNILRGEMSLVGPRPTSFGAETYQLWQTERLDVIPGITCVWQVFGRTQLEFEDRLRLDIAYIDRASLWLDINILIQTIAAVFKQRGAH